jgi:threonine dehydratase
VVDEAMLRQAVAGVVSHERLVTEGAGAVGVAAVLSGRLDVRGKRVAIVLSGANIDQETLSTIV